MGFGPLRRARGRVPPTRASSRPVRVTNAGNSRLSGSGPIRTAPKAAVLIAAAPLEEVRDDDVSNLNLGQVLPPTKRARSRPSSPPEIGEGCDPDQPPPGGRPQNLACARPPNSARQPRESRGNPGCRAEIREVARPESGPDEAYRYGWSTTPREEDPWDDAGRRHRERHASVRVNCWVK